MNISELFARGEFVVSAEVGPPKGCHPEEIVAEALAIAGSICVFTNGNISVEVIRS